MKGKIEYLGLPYTDDDPLMEDWRADVSDKVAADLFARENRIVFAPISAWHHIARKHALPGTFEHWSELDEEFIKISKKLLIITLPGWEKSNGVNGEIKLAHKYNVPIEYIDPEPYIKRMEKKMRCTICGAKLVSCEYGAVLTLLGYHSPPGHDHDDNCLKKVYFCENGHSQIISKRRRCPNPECDWVGKEYCSCHDGKKVDEWPEVNKII